MFRFRTIPRTVGQVSFVRFNSTKAYDEALAIFKTDLKKAMIAKDVLKKDTIRSIMSTIKNEEINGLQKTEFELYRVFNKMVKQRKDSIAEYQKLNRSDLAEKEQLETSVIEEYLHKLPVASAEEVEKKVEEWLKEKLQNEVPPIGKIMGAVLEELASSWNSSPKIIKALIPKFYKTLSQK